MKILVIGGTKFVGRLSVPELVYEGHEVTLFNRGTDPEAHKKLNLRTLKGDRKVPGSLAAAIGDEYFDATLDMIAYNAADVELTLSEIGSHTGHYVLISTASVYDEPRPTPVRETDQLVDDPALSYGYNKVKAEEAAFAYGKEHGLAVSALRLPAMYGEYDHQAREYYFIKRLFDGRRRFVLPEGGCGSYHREYGGNVAGQFLSIVQNREASAGKAFNSGHANIPNYKETILLAASLIGAEVELYSVPASQFPHIPNLAAPLTFIQSTARLESLGYTERFGIAEGLARMMTWFKDNPIKELVPPSRNLECHFDYEWEDKLIDEGIAKPIK